jgi:hypothetical protein
MLPRRLRAGDDTNEARRLCEAAAAVPVPVKVAAAIDERRLRTMTLTLSMVAPTVFFDDDDDKEDDDDDNDGGFDASIATDATEFPKPAVAAVVVAAAAVIAAVEVDRGSVAMTAATAAAAFDVSLR